MKKLLILFMLMGLVTSVNAQNATLERDIFTEQAIYSVSNFKLGSEKFISSPYSNETFLEVDEVVVNPFQYIQQQVGYISIASTSYEALSFRAAGRGEELDGVKPIVITHYDITTTQGDEGDSECQQTENINS